MIKNEHVQGGRAFNQKPPGSASATAANASQRKLHKMTLQGLGVAHVRRNPCAFYLSHNKALAACL